MEYLKLFWDHKPDHEPVIILYEVNLTEERLAIRSIDIFSDGTTRNIDDLYSGAIEITPIPTVEEFNSHIWGHEFHADFISKEEFEKIWNNHFYDGKMNETIH
ncbi:MAG: hypothetical protein J6C33_00960 [Lachnospiraceae bacterium]|nr:hypothetical protein [Lachnospiraceae bacterium]